MSEQESAAIPEKQFAKGTVGTVLEIILKGEPNVPPPGPELVQMDSYDSSYLKVLQCGWYPQGELVDAAALRVIFMPLKAGDTEIQFLIQPRFINPLNLPVTFFVAISS
jgi:hypothetical protein